MHYDKFKECISFEANCKLLHFSWGTLGLRHRDVMFLEVYRWESEVGHKFSDATNLSQCCDKGASLE